MENTKDVVRIIDIGEGESAVFLNDNLILDASEGDDYTTFTSVNRAANNLSEALECEMMSINVPDDIAHTLSGEREWGEVIAALKSKDLWSPQTFLRLTEEEPYAFVTFSDPSGEYPDVRLEFTADDASIKVEVHQSFIGATDGPMAEFNMPLNARLEKSQGSLSVPQSLNPEGTGGIAFRLKPGQEYIYVTAGDVDMIAKVSSEGVIIDAMQTGDHDAIYSLCMAYDEIFEEYCTDAPGA